MSNIDKIRQEIERRIKLYSITNEKEQWIVNTYWSVLSFLDSLPEEKPSEDLEEEIERVVENYNSLAHGSRVMKPSGIEKIARHFAEWGAKHSK